MEDEIYFEITDGPDIIRIEPLQWSHPNSDDEWDKKWIRSRITIKGGAFQGRFSCDLFCADFESFKNGLIKAYDNLKDTATFTTIEGQIEITCVGDGLGHFEVDCEVMDEAGIGNTLNIKMSFDQTTIPELVGQLDRISNKFSPK
jgi:hypothetical protein